MDEGRIQHALLNSNITTQVAQKASSAVVLRGSGFLISLGTPISRLAALARHHSGEWRSQATSNAGEEYGGAKKTAVILRSEATKNLSFRNHRTKTDSSRNIGAPFGAQGKQNDRFRLSAASMVNAPADWAALGSEQPSASCLFQSRCGTACACPKSCKLLCPSSRPSHRRYARPCLSRRSPADTARA